MISLEYTIENSGDSSLEYYAYSEGILSITLDLGEIDKRVTMKLVTDIMSFHNFYLDKLEDSSLKTCRIEIKELSNVLSVENGIYVPSKIFGKFMDEKRSNYHLAYGEKSNSKKFIFSLVGYNRLVSCIISELDNITIDVIK